jgi:nitrogen regulatory protein P-II 1
MKNLVLVIHTNMQNDLADQLRPLPQIKSFTFIEVQGHGARDEQDAFLSTRDRVVGYTPHIRVDILLDDADIPIVMEHVRQVVRHARDQGLYWILPVEENGSL